MMYHQKESCFSKALLQPANLVVRLPARSSVSVFGGSLTVRFQGNKYNGRMQCTANFFGGV